MLKPLLIAGALVMTMAAVYAQNVPTATCKGCPATYISNDELQAYLKRAIARNQIDQQVRSVDAGKSGVAVGMVHRTKLDKPQPNSVAEHDHVSEVYHVISGSATLVTGPDLVDAQRRPATNENVRLLNGPGSNAAVDPQRRHASVESRRRDHHSRRHRTPVHEDRRSDHLPHDQDRSRQGRAVEG